MLLGLLGLQVAAPAGAAPLSVALGYEGYLSGVHLLHLDAGLVSADAGYRMTFALHTVATGGAIERGHTEAGADGSWAGAVAMPRRLESVGAWGSEQRHLVVDFVAGQPVVRLMQPPARPGQPAVPAQVSAGSIDGLSLLAQLIRTVSRGGACGMQAAMFDGDGVVDFAMLSGPNVLVPPSPLSMYAGVAHRCDFTTRKRTTPAAPASGRVGHGYALFAPVRQGGPAVPVRIIFHAGWLGDAVLYLTTAHSA